jgi:exocyst complex component 4
VDSSGKQINKSLKGYEEQLTLALRETVPGLVNQGNEATTQAAFSTIGLDDRLTAAGQHKSLLPADAFHVVLLLQPTLIFLERMVGILPAGAESEQAASLFLDEFVLNNYLPQLEEKVTDVFHTAVSGPEAFREDGAYHELNPQPLVKVKSIATLLFTQLSLRVPQAAVQIVALVNTLCTMLQTTPFHKERHSRLILGIIVQFYQQCSDQFRELVTRESMDSNAPPVILGAQWAQNSEMSRLLTALRECSVGRIHGTSHMILTIII